MVNKPFSTPLPHPIMLGRTHIYPQTATHPVANSIATPTNWHFACTCVDNVDNTGNTLIYNNKILTQLLITAFITPTNRTYQQKTKASTP